MQRCVRREGNAGRGFYPWSVSESSTENGARLHQLARVLRRCQDAELWVWPESRLWIRDAIETSTLPDRGLDVGDPTHCLMWLISRVCSYTHDISTP